MSFKLEIANGLNSHGEWKQRLIDAISTGKSEWKSQTVCKDDQCEFGKWLHACGGPEKTSAHYIKVKTLHADFHKVAANILTLALNNEKEEAIKSISTGSPYLLITTKLTREMMAWSNSI